jgi:very-short-patch-repair endonuclease
MPKKLLTIQELKQKFKTEGFELLSKEYTNFYSTLDLQCPKGHIFQTNRHKFFYAGSRCHKCWYKQLSKNLAYSHSFVAKQINRQGYKLLSIYKDSATPLTIECPQGHIYKAKWNNFQQGQRCAKCDDLLKAQQHRLSCDYVRECIEKEGFALLSDRYEGVRAPISVRCPRDHVYKTMWNSFQQGYRCPKCNASKGENATYSILNEMYPNRVIRWHKFGPFRLDFYIPHLPVAVEYDGQQHFEPVRFRGISEQKAQEIFTKIQQRDKQKNTLCKQKGLSLLRIPYSYYENRTPTSFSKKVQEMLTALI